MSKDASPETKQAIVDAIREGNVETADDIDLINQDEGPVVIRQVEFTNSFETSELNYAGGMVISWSKPGVGFGELSFSIRNGEFVCDSETMGPTFIKEVLAALVDKAKII